MEMPRHDDLSVDSLAEQWESEQKALARRARLRLVRHGTARALLSSLNR
jgi:hypothetical protein